MSPDRPYDDPDHRARKETRRILPAVSISIRVDFHVADSPFIGRLWDISPSGACLLFPPEVPLEVSQKGPITLHHPSIGESIRSHYNVAWVDRLSHALYCGGVFTESIQFESTFLSTLMRRGDDTPGRRLTDLQEGLHHFPGFR
jgi:hypothetical protein